jgi:hypothetical protein
MVSRASASSCVFSTALTEEMEVLKSRLKEAKALYKNLIEGI